MKKTLIALAVAASAVVSSSAMAWTQNGTGGSVDLGGTLTPVEKVTPWEVKVGAAVNDLNASLTQGTTKVVIPVTKAIPILGIRSAQPTFQGRSGISPQISYNDAVDLNSFNAGTTSLSMEVRNAQGDVIGSLTAPVFAGAETSQTTVDGSGNYSYSIYASEAGKGFFGGLAKNAPGVTTDVFAKLSAIDPEFVANYVDQGVSPFYDKVGQTEFGATTATYSAYYGSGIEQGQDITITLNQPVVSDAIVWNASLPVTVSYQ